MVPVLHPRGTVSVCVASAVDLAGLGLAPGGRRDRDVRTRRLCPSPACRHTGMTRHLMLAIVAVVMFGALHLNVGLIPVGDGLGWDGEEYARMLRRGWDRGGTNTALRPMIVWLAQPAFEMTRDVVRAFDITNYVYVGLLAFLYSRFMERYGASMLTCALAVLCISVSAAFQL